MEQIHVHHEVVTKKIIHQLLRLIRQHRIAPNYENGKLSFSCETEDVEYEYYISTPHFNTFDEDIAAPDKLMITVIATKDDYEPSDPVAQEIDKNFFRGKKGDVNEDGKVNGTDIQSVINIIVNPE